MTRARSALLATCLALAHPGFARDWYVNVATGLDTPGYGSGPTEPFKTITYALAVAVFAGDSVRVAAGVYDDTTGEVFPLLLHGGVSLIGAGSARSTITRQGSSGYPLVTVETKTGDLTRMVIQGFEFNGENAGVGEGIRIESGVGNPSPSGPVCRDNLFRRFRSSAIECPGDGPMSRTKDGCS